MAWYVPFNYEKINISEGTFAPSTVKYRNNYTFAFWERALFQRAVSVLEFTLPDGWSGSVRDFFLYCLFRFGKVAIFDNAKFGMSFQPCNLSGWNFYYQPVWALIANPMLSTKLEIGTECEILKLTPDYLGIFDIIDYYAEKLSLLDNAVNMSLINSKFGLMIGARSKAAAEALKKMFDKINKGDPAVIYDSKIISDSKNQEELFTRVDLPNPKENYLTHDQLQDFQTLINNFDAEVGIPSVPYQKKERLVTSEAESRKIDATSRSIVWYDTLKSSIDRIKKLYPDIRLDVELRYPPEEEVSTDVTGDTVPDRNL